MNAQQLLNCIDCTDAEFRLMNMPPLLHPTEFILQVLTDSLRKEGLIPSAQDLLDSVQVEYTEQELIAKEQRRTDINITKLFGVGRPQRARVTGVKARKTLGSHSHNSGEASH